MPEEKGCLLLQDWEDAVQLLPANSQEFVGHKNTIWLLNVKFRKKTKSNQRCYPTKPSDGKPHITSITGRMAISRENKQSTVSFCFPVLGQTDTYYIQVHHLLCRGTYWDWRTGNRNQELNSHIQWLGPSFSRSRLHFCQACAWLHQNHASLTTTSYLGVHYSGMATEQRTCRKDSSLVSARASRRYIILSRRNKSSKKMSHKTSNCGHTFRASLIR